MSRAGDDFSGWIGRSLEEVDVVTPRLVTEYRVTLDPYLAPVGEGEVPLGFHWCLSPFLAPMQELGPDGHPQKGGFLPPIPLPRRMWAGGHIDFFSPIHVGDHVSRRSTIASVEAKQGRTGLLWFVGVHHEYTTARGVAISERHDIVYREAAVPGARPAPATGGEAPGLPAATWHVMPSPTLLFRYSALTFNGHRIHYDQPYATGIEGYDDLVVHGPLQAILMLNLAAAKRKGVPKRFSYRGLSPLTSGAPFDVAVRETTCWTQRPGGPVNMQGELTW
jgi:3-methylfumaryl-CoA hydratase